MTTRRDLLDRVEAHLRGRDPRRVEATLCFLRALLVGIDDDAVVAEETLERVAAFTGLGRNHLTVPPPRASVAPPATRAPRILFVGRADAARLPMIEAVAAMRLVGLAELRAASISPVAVDPRATKVLRLAGYATEGIATRSLSVDDLTWADRVVTFSGERDDWARFIPRSIAHDHHTIDDPRATPSGDDELEPFREVLRAVERAVSAIAPPRSSRLPPPPAPITVAPSRASRPPPSARGLTSHRATDPPIPPPPKTPERT